MNKKEVSIKQGQNKAKINKNKQQQQTNKEMKKI